MPLSQSEQKTYDRLLVKERDRRLTSAERSRLARLRDKANAATGRALAPKAPPPAPAQYTSMAEADERTQRNGPEPTIDLNNPETVKFIQTILKNAGFYTGRVDGIWGPKTQAANDAWQTAGRPGAPAPAEPAAGGVEGGDPLAPASPSTPAGVPAVAGGTPAVDMSNWEQTVREQFPALAGFLDIPEIRDNLRAAVAEGWPPDKLQARIQATNWWRTTPAKTRQWFGLVALDPASAERQVLEHTAKVKQAADDYLIDLGDDAARRWSEQLLKGEITEDSFKQHLIGTAVSKFGVSVEAPLKAGVTVRQLADPYVQHAARLLGISDASVDLKDPKWQRALQASIGPDGPKAMTLWEWDSALKRDPVYGFDRTPTGRQAAAQIATDIERLFGRAG